MIKRVYLVLLVICLCISNLLVCIAAPQTGNNGWAYPDVSQYDGSQIKIGRGDANAQPQSNGNQGYVDTSGYEEMTIGKLGKDKNIGGFTDINDTKAVTEYPQNTTVDNMETILFGSYPQSDITGNMKEPIEWIVLEKQVDKALLLSKKMLFEEYHITEGHWTDYNEVVKNQIGNFDYKNNEHLKLLYSIENTDEENKYNAYLNDVFLTQAFSESEINQILDTNIVTNRNCYIYDGQLLNNWDMDIKDRFNIIDSFSFTNSYNGKVFELTNAEIEKYLNSNSKRKCGQTNYFNINEDDLNEANIYYTGRDGMSKTNLGYYIESGKKFVYFDAKTGNIIDSDKLWGQNEDIWIGGTRNFHGYRPAVWVKLSNQNNEVANTNNAIIESANKNTNQNTLNDNHFDINLLAQISNVEELPKYDSNTRIKDVGVIKFGTFYNSNIDDYSTIEWVVIEKDELNKKALLLSKDIIGSKNWTSEEQCKNKDIIWETSSIRKWLNGEFYQKYFTSDEKKSILKTHLVNNKNTQYNTNSGNETDDKVFLLSIDDIEKYFNIDNLGKENDNRLIAESGLILGKNEDGKKFAEKSTRGENWWLRTIGEKEDYVADITNTGRLRYAGFNVRGITVNGSYALGTRPAIWVSYDPNMSNSNESNFDKINSETNTVNSVLGDNIHIEGADVIQNPDGSIQIGGTAEEGSQIIQKGFDDNDIQYETQDEIDRIIADSNEATFKKPIDRVYYYAKHDTTNKTVTSINKKNSYNGLLGTGLFSNKTYYNIEIKFNEDTKKRLSKYAELEWNGSYKTGQDWVLLAGNSMDNLENVSWFGITPFKDSDRVANIKELSYYQKGTLQVHSLSANEQNRVYNKLKNAKVIVLATHNVIKDDRVVFSEEEKLGNVERFEYVKDDGSHINLVNAYIDCEDKVVTYTNDHNGYFLYVKDGFTGDLAYHEEIVAPKKNCNKFEILVFGNDSLSYSIYGNKVNFLAGKEVGGLKKFQVFGGKMDWIFELNTKDGFEDYEKYYLENKDKW